MVIDPKMKKALRSESFLLVAGTGLLRGDFT